MPSLFEPCGLPQMIACIYGALPVVNDTGGLHDTIHPLDDSNDTGNGFLFENFDPAGLMWAIDQAMAFYNRPEDIRKRQIERVMIDAAATFNHDVNARQYIDLYEQMLNRPLIV